VPSKKVFIFAVACAVALLSILFAYTYQPKKAQKAAFVPAVSVQSQTALLKNQLSDSDSDSDGLKDWEETLWNTDKNNPDSDADGVKDGDEVKIGRNPAKKGPNDKLATKDLPPSLQSQAKSGTTGAGGEGTNGAGAYDPNNTTSELSRRLFANYMQLKKSGQTITPEVQAELISQVLVGEYAKSASVPVYTTRDVKIAASETKESIRAYGNAMGAIMKRDSPRVDIAELGLLQLAVENNDPKKLEKIAIMVEAYEKMLRNMMAVEVPPSAASLHAAIITSLAGLIWSDKAIVKYFSDPVTAMSGLQQYNQTALDVENAFAGVELYFNNQGISYSVTEPGRSFTHSFK
jgi:hypothetical protein